MRIIPSYPHTQCPPCPGSPGQRFSRLTFGGKILGARDQTAGVICIIVDVNFAQKSLLVEYIACVCLQN